MVPKFRRRKFLCTYRTREIFQLYTVHIYQINFSCTLYHDVFELYISNQNAMKMKIYYFFENLTGSLHDTVSVPIRKAICNYFWPVKNRTKCISFCYGHQISDRFMILII